MQARYGHVGGHKRRKGQKAEPASPASQSSPQPPKARKAVFTAKVTPQEDLQDYAQPKEASKPKAVVSGEGIESLVTLLLERANDYIKSEPTTPGSAPQISSGEIKALASSVRNVLEKHGGLEGTEGIGEYLPEISLLIAAGIVGMKLWQGMRYRAGHHPGTSTFAKAAGEAESPQQKTAEAYAFFEKPEVKAEIDKAMEHNRVGE
jgi:hypothetical protein